MGDILKRLVYGTYLFEVTSRYYIDCLNKCVLQFGVMQSNNVLLMTSICTNKSSLDRLEPVDHKQLCLVNYYILIQ